jgi:anti-sigma factor RsiW
MTDKWKDILSGSGAIDSRKLMDYLEGKLTDEEKHEVESRLADSPFLDEAMEGLSQMKDKQMIATILTELNRQLDRKIAQRKTRRTRTLQFPVWLLLATAAVIILAVLAYVVYRMYTTA